MGIASERDNSWGLVGHDSLEQGPDRHDAGIWSFYLSQGGLRWIHAGDTEILRGIDVVFRDENWGTLPLKFAKAVVENKDGAWTCHQSGRVGDLAEVTLTMTV